MNLAHVMVRPIRLADVTGFRWCVGAVMRERKFLAYLEPFPLAETAAFVTGNIDKGNPQFVAEDAGRIVGRCDVCRETVPTYAHEGTRVRGRKLDGIYDEVHMMVLITNPGNVSP